MAQRQFRSDDTDKWLDGFGTGIEGSVTLSGTYGAGNGGYLGACSGTAGQKTLTTPAGWGLHASGKWNCLIHQTRGTGAGNWELNQIININSTTSTLKYALMNSYGTGSQCVLMFEYNGITISGTLTAPNWDGTTGGIIALLNKGTTTISGTVNLLGGNGSGPNGPGGNYTGATGAGFRGGDCQTYNGSDNSTTGEGTAGAKVARQYTANGNGGGVGSNNTGYNSGGPGGGNATAGTLGSGGTQPEAGIAVGNAGLTLMNLGGGGGGGFGGWANSYAGAGGAGGGICLIINKDINISGSINLSGGDGGSGGSTGDGQVGAGGGAGGSCLIKSKTAVLGTNKIVSNGGVGGAGARAGGAGSSGRIHLDYSVSYSGSTTPSIDVTNDLTIIDRFNGSLFFAQY